jgi:hypothetical protein
MGLRHNGSDTEPLEMILDSLYSIFYIKRTCIWGADGTNPQQGNLTPPVLSCRIRAAYVPLRAAT